MSDATRADFHVGSVGGNFAVSADSDVVANDKVIMRKIMSIFKHFQRLFHEIILSTLRGETISAIFIGITPHSILLIYINFFIYPDSTKSGSAAEQLAGAYERLVLTLQGHVSRYLLLFFSIGAVLSIFMFWLASVLLATDGSVRVSAFPSPGDEENEDRPDGGRSAAS
jgi:hypothetical protein